MKTPEEIKEVIKNKIGLNAVDCATIKAKAVELLRKKIDLELTQLLGYLSPQALLEIINLCDKKPKPKQNTQKETKKRATKTKRTTRRN